MILGILTLVFFYYISDGFLQLLGLRFPSAVLGIVFLFIALCIFPSLYDRLQTISRFVSKNLVVFFLPAGVGVLNSIGILSVSGWQLAGAILISTILTLVVSGWILQKLEKGKK